MVQLSIASSAPLRSHVPSVALASLAASMTTCLITTGSSMQRSDVSAMTFTGPPQTWQISMSILNTRFSLCASMPSDAGHGCAKKNRKRK